MFIVTAMSPDPEFLSGLELGRIFYEEAVRPLLEEAYPGLPHAAANVGTGSEVLGFDTPRSADHEWGPRLNLFLEPALAPTCAPVLRRLLAERLPKEIRGWPTHFQHDDPADPIGQMRHTEGPVNHRVMISEVGAWMQERLGLDPAHPVPSLADWLTMPQQRLAETTGGAVYHDGLGTLTAARATLAWYPDQVWRYLLACQWQRVSQEEAFVGRCAEVGDELGSAVVAARLVRDLMRLCLLLGRRYAPYSKWLGSAFAQLPVAERLSPVLRATLAADDYPTRERHLGEAYGIVAREQNQSGLAPWVDPSPRSYHERPYQVLHAERFAQALVSTLTDPRLRALPLVGAVDQWADSTDFLDRRLLIRSGVVATLALA